jgi:hypothetical protein
MYIENSSSPILSDSVNSPGVNAPLSETAATSNASAVLPTMEKQIVTIENRLHSLKGHSADDLVDDLLKWGKGAGESAETALSAAQYAIVYAWAAGCVFNLAKEIVGHSRFGQWRDAKASELGISVRKAQQWMKLAKDCWDVRALLAPGATLTGVYRATGVLPESAPAPPAVECDDGANGDPHQPASSPAEPVLSFLAEGRKRLRHLLQLGEILGEKDRDRLEEEKAAYLALFDKLLTPSSHE